MEQWWGLAGEVGRAEQQDDPTGWKLVEVGSWRRLEIAISLQNRGFM